MFSKNCVLSLSLFSLTTLSVLCFGIKTEKSKEKRIELKFALCLRLQFVKVNLQTTERSCLKPDLI